MQFDFRLGGTSCWLPAGTFRHSGLQIRRDWQNRFCPQSSDVNGSLGPPDAPRVPTLEAAAWMDGAVMRTAATVLTGARTMASHVGHDSDPPPRP